MGASFLKAGWLVPKQLQKWQRAALAHLKRQVPQAKDVIWVFTSGTQSVGRVKCVGLSFDAIWESARAVNAHLSATAKDKWSIEIPTYHVGGYSILARAHLSRSKISYGGKWSPQKFASRIQAKKTTLTSLVPTQVFDLVAANSAAPKCLRAAVVGGGSLDANIYLRARELGWPLLPSYGLTECASQVATASLKSLEAKEFPGLEVLSHARVDFRNQRVFVQCLSACQWIATATEDGQFTMEDPLREGWLVTEDLGEWKGARVAGRSPQIQILGRQDDVVKVFGVLVALPQVESDLREFCRKKNLALKGDFALIGANGVREGAQIILVTSGEKSGFDEAVRRYNSSVSGPYRIQAVKKVDQIPRTALGKVKKGELSQTLLSLNS